MNVLLISPEFPDTFWSFKHALKLIRKKATLPPLGMLTVGAMLPPDWNKRLVDLNVSHLKDADLEWADLAFITGMVIQRESAAAVIARCKAAGVRMVAGGPLFTSEHEHFPDVDHFVLNEAETTLAPFLADLAAGHPKRMYASQDFPDITATPPPLWHLADLGKYAAMSIQYSRGCPFECEFCNVTSLFGHTPRTKSAAQVVHELDTLYAAGWRSGVFFVDDNLIGNKRRLKRDLLPALIEWRRAHPEINYNTEASINLADDEDLMQMMVEAGFDTVFIGIETPDEKSLAECGKTQNRNRDLIEDIKRIQRAGLQVQGGFIVGFDQDSASIFQRQIDFIQKSGIVTAMVGMLQAVPGTKLFKRLQGEGRLVGQTSGDNVDGTTNFAPRMGLKKLRAGYAGILQHIYSPKHYYKRLRTFLREYRAPKVKRPMRFAHIMSFARANLHLGVIGKERIEYWKLLCWTCVWRPRLLPLAVTLAGYGHHFRRVAELNSN
jgi:radical SAM superfamily enzyme YgiQ (UPF0313 family)